LSGIDIPRVIGAGTMEFRVLVQVEYSPALLEVYNPSLRKFFLLGHPARSFVGSGLHVSRAGRRISIEAKINEAPLPPGDKK
jgi:hypothetical protein